MINNPLYLWSKGRFVWYSIGEDQVYDSTKLSVCMVSKLTSFVMNGCNNQDKRCTWSLKIQNQPENFNVGICSRTFCNVDIFVKITKFEIFISAECGILKGTQQSAIVNILCICQIPFSSSRRVHMIFISCYKKVIYPSCCLYWW